ncbi:MAG TPA: carboxypeptidase regulatory-like domain-containing protein, partial [Gemmatimonadaceae bacterium]|nr:carboxypeptidase regulatory-like domain-containing protein [Gemmatimonadaceae bacterium]
PIEGATVSGEWLEMSFRKGTVTRRVPRLVATTAKNGWFGMCNVPKSGTMMLRASSGADSTGRIEVYVPEEGFLRHELYLGSAQTVLTSDTTRSRLASTAPPRRMHFGHGHLSGTVTSLSGGDPLANAQIGIADGPKTRTNARGEWSISDAPTGTHMLEIRALGYYPERRRVDVVTDAAPLRTALSTLRAVLDTVRIRATRLSGANFAGFEERRRSGIGKYLSAAEIERRHPVVVSDLFRNMAGVRVELDANGVDYLILVRGTAAEWCPAAIYLDGMALRGVTASDLDVWVRTHEVKAIEVYTGLGAPMAVQEGMSDCGSILIWTK